MHLRYAEPTRQEEDFFRILKKRVFARLHEKNQTRYANLNMWLRVTFFFTGFFASWSCLVFAQMPVALTLAFCVLLSFFGTGIALNVGHETSHGNLSPRPWVNSFLYRFSMSLLGTSDLNWKTGHIETHHKYVNVGGSDVGVEANGALRFTAHTKWFPKFRYQHFFAIPLYCFYTLAWVIFRDWRVLLEGQVSGAKLNPSFKKFFDLFLIKAFYFGYLLVIPMVFSRFSVGEILFGFVFINAVYSLYIACFLFVSHLAIGPAFPRPNSEGRLPMSYIRHQLVCTMDVMPESRFASFCLGGFNTHAVHHLFPNICSVHYPELTKILKETCHEFKMPYLEKSLGAALKAHFDFLYKMGQEPMELKNATSPSAIKPQETVAWLS